MKKALLANLQWKLLALLLAVILWLVVVDEPELVAAHVAPLFYKNLPRNLEIGSDVPDRVRLELRGPSGRMTPDLLSGSSVTLDLSEIQAPGERTLSVNAGTIKLPAGVTLLRSVPSEVRLHLERVLEKEVPVRARTGAPPPYGYRVTSVSVSPERLRIAGPESHVSQVEAAQTDAIDLSGVVGRTEFRVHAYLSDPQIRFETPPSVVVRVDVEKN